MGKLKHHKLYILHGKLLSIEAKNQFHVEHKQNVFLKTKNQTF